MKNCLNLLGAASAAAVFATAAIAQDTPTADTVVATVNGAEITLGHMAVVRAQLPPEYQNLEEQTLFDGILEQIIRQQALAQEVSGETPNHVRLGLENQERAELANIAMDAHLEKAVTDDAVQTAYDERFKDWQPATEYNASHILVETEEDATAIKGQLDEGGDFAEIAKEKSTGPSGPAGGELGWFGEGVMVPEFETAVTSLAVGEVSAPVQTQFGWHVIKMNETRETEKPSLDTMRDQIEQEIQQEIASVYINDVAANAEVTRPGEGAFDPSVLTSIDLNGN